MLSLPKLPASVGRAKASALSGVTRAQRVRLARRLAAQVQRHGQRVPALTRPDIQTPEWTGETGIATTHCDVAALPMAGEWLQALVKQGWLTAEQVGSPQTAAGLFSVIAGAVDAMANQVLDKVDACLPSHLERESSLSFRVAGLQALHASLVGGAPWAAQTQILSLVVEVDGPAMVALSEPEGMYERVLRGAVESLAKAMRHRRLCLQDNGLQMCNPMLEELLTDLLASAQVVDGKRIYDPAGFEAFCDELGYEVGDPEVVAIISARADALAAFHEAAAERSPVDPTSAEGRTWMASAPDKQIEVIRSFMALTDLAAKSEYSAPGGDCEGVTGGCIVAMEIPPGFEDEIDEYLNAMSGESDFARIDFNSVAQLVKAMPHVMVQTAVANAALTLMLENESR